MINEKGEPVEVDIKIENVEFMLVGVSENSVYGKTYLRVEDGFLSMSEEGGHTSRLYRNGTDVEKQFYDKYGVKLDKLYGT